MTTNWPLPFNRGWCLNQLYHKKRKEKKEFLLGYEQGPTVNSSQRPPEERARDLKRSLGGEGGGLIGWVEIRRKRGREELKKKKSRN